MPKPTCTVPECVRESLNRSGMCSMHYSRFIKTGSPGAAAPGRVLGQVGCLIEECPNPHRARGYCTKHYKNLRTTGDPASKSKGRPGELSPRWLSVPTYAAVHGRLKTQRGKATRFLCVCGASARQWSYSHNDPDQLWEVVGGYLLPYSADINHYDPLCTYCHRQRDVENATKRSFHG